MSTKILYQSSSEEKLIWYGLVGTYPIYSLGALYITGSILGWIVLSIAMLRVFIEGPEKEAKISFLIWIWIISMLIMLVSLFIAHADWDLGLAKTIKSSIGWMKGWALLAIFPIIGAIVNIRKEIIIRAVCLVAIHSLVFGVVTFLAYIVRIPGELFISPLKIVGGPGENFFSVSLYSLNPETGSGRWQFFGPWAPAAGLLSCIYVIFCLNEKNKQLKLLGVMGCLVMCLLSQSRAGWVIFAFIVPLYLFFGETNKSYFLLLASIVIPTLLLFGDPIYEWVINSYQQIKESRPDSTRVRTALANIALQRSISEAPIWGHGIVEKGPLLVEGMPIGSHHSWYGLFFVKGIVGVMALAIPLSLTALYLAIKSIKDKTSRMAFCMLLIFILYSFFENLEILSYIYWPALLWIGIALNPNKGDTNEEI